MSERHSTSTDTSQTRRQDQTTSSSTYSARAPYEEPASDGWVIFASTMLVLVGAFQAVIGLTALAQSDYYVVGQSGLVVNVDYTAWGWVHLGLGVVALIAGFGLLTRAMWARVLGIGLAVLSAVVNLAFVAAYPWWSILVIALDVVVIYAISVHATSSPQPGR